MPAPSKVKKPSELCLKILDPNSYVWLTPAGEVLDESDPDNPKVYNYTNHEDLVPVDHPEDPDFLEQVVLSVYSLDLRGTGPITYKIRDAMMNEYSSGNLYAAYVLAELLWEVLWQPPN